MITGLDHVQLAMPPGGEEAARAFYAGLLGMEEVAKPAALAGRGGCWFELSGVAVHLGVEDPFIPARKAHPAFLVEDYEEIEALLREAGAPVEPDTTVPGVRRLYTADPFGNRIEVIADGDGSTQRPW